MAREKHLNQHSDQTSEAASPVSTAPHLSIENELAELRNENTRLRNLLAAATNGVAADPTDVWPETISYHDQPFSGARLAGITKDRTAIRASTDFAELPTPTNDQRQLEKDFVRWGYCLVADALSKDQIQIQSDRLVDQAAAEKAAKVAHLSHRGSGQTVFNMLPKGQVFRDLIALEPHAAHGAPLVETLLGKILGDGYYLATAHGSLVHQGGGRQELHQDQGFVPLPHPPFPLYCLIIWCLTDFSLAEGGTYVVPGSHRTANGENQVRPETHFENLATDNLVAVTAPAGTCLLTDSRLLHSGGKRTAPGTRLAARIFYARGTMRQQENQLVATPENIIRNASPKLQKLIGLDAYYGLGMVEGNARAPHLPKRYVGELSLSNPGAFTQDFDWRYTEDARHQAQLDWDAAAEYRGRNRD